jgi:hypothetical protein
LTFVTETRLRSWVVPLVIAWANMSSASRGTPADTQTSRERTSPLVQRNRTAASGAREGRHDDLVLAVALGVLAGEELGEAVDVWARSLRMVY